MKCLKCGHVRIDSDVELAPAYACPKCGVVYAKAIEERERLNNGDSETSPVRRKRENKKAKKVSRLLRAVSEFHFDFLPVDSSSIDSKEALDAKVIGALAAIIIFIGAFAPIFSVPIARSLSYSDKQEGMLILLFSLTGLFFSLTNRARLLWQTALATMAVMVMTVTHFWFLMSHLTNQASESLENNPFRELANIALNSATPKWGWVVLITGVVFFFISAYKARKSELTDKLVNKSLMVILYTLFLSAAVGVGIGWLDAGSL